jgi:hypothetical protein
MPAGPPLIGKLRCLKGFEAFRRVSLATRGITPPFNKNALQAHLAGGVSTRPYPMPRRVPRLTLVKWHTGASLKVMGEFMREKPVIGVWLTNYNSFAVGSVVGPYAGHRYGKDAAHGKGCGGKSSI